MKDRNVFILFIVLMTALAYLVEGWWGVVYALAGCLLGYFGATGVWTVKHRRGKRGK